MAQTDLYVEVLLVPSRAVAALSALKTSSVEHLSTATVLLGLFLPATSDIFIRNCSSPVSRAALSSLVEVHACILDCRASEQPTRVKVALTFPFPHPGRFAGVRTCLLRLPSQIQGERHDFERMWSPGYWIFG